MKHLIICTTLLISIQIASGQDKIITVKNDTIDCRIVSISHSYIQYEQKGENGYIGKFIQTEQVAEYLRKSSSQQQDLYDNQASRQKIKPEFPWLIGIYAGRGILLASTIDDENEMSYMGISKSKAEDFYKQYKRGWSFSGDIHYLISDNFGLGAKYSLFVSTAQIEDYMLPTSIFHQWFDEFLCLTYKKTQYIHFAGPSALFRQWLDTKSKFQLMETLSAGYVFYRDELRILPTSVLGSSGNGLALSDTWGADIGLSLNYNPISWLSVGINTNFKYAHLKKVYIYSNPYGEIEKNTLILEKKDYEYLTRFDYSSAINFHF
jgi:hypothetical protein